MEGKNHISSPHDVLVLIKEGEVLTKKRIGIDEEVGTSRRTNIPQVNISSGGGGGGGRLSAADLRPKSGKKNYF